MGKELTKAQLTFVDLYDSYTLSLSSDVIAVPCNPDGEALNTKTYKIKYSVRAGEKMIAAKCESAVLSSDISGITITSSDSSESAEGTISVKVNATTDIPEDSGINISVKTQDSNEFAFNRFISFMNIKKGQDGDSGRGIKTIQEEYAINNSPSQAPVENSSDWGTDPKTPTEDKQYLWNRELLTYDKADENGQTQSYTTPRIISIYGKDGEPGRGIASIVEYYAVSDSSQSPAKVQIIGGGGTVSVEQYRKYENNTISGDIQDVSFDPSTRYYTIDMNNQSKSCSIVKLTFNILYTTNITISCINNGESSCDYMRVSTISTDPTCHFTDSYDTASDTHPDKPFTEHCFAGSYNTLGQHHTAPYNVVFNNVAPGTHYVYIKVQKDGSIDKEDAYQFKCDEVSTSWQTDIPADYGPDYPYLWNYTKFDYTDGGSDSSDPQVISHWGVDGEPAFALKVVTDKGDVFKEGIEEIKLSLEAYSGESKINIKVPYIWSYYTFDRDDGDGWTELSSGEDYIENISLLVSISEPHAYSMFKCQITYKNQQYSDYETLKQDVQDAYLAKTVILQDKDLDGNCVVLYTELTKNGQEIDGLLTRDVYFFENLKISSNDNGAFYISGTSFDYGFLKGTKDQLVYLLTYNSMQYFQPSSAGEYDCRLEGSDYWLYEKPDTYSGQMYESRDSDGKTYRLILAQYDGSYWRPYKPYDTYEYCYINSSIEDVSNITFSNSKVFVVDKRRLGNAKELHTTVYNKAYAQDGSFAYYVPYDAISGNNKVHNIWKIYNYHTDVDTIITSCNSGAFQAIKTSYIEECFERKSDGVYINQVKTTINETTGVAETEIPFYVKIASEEIGFYSKQNTEPMVHIGNASTNIRNTILDQDTIINGNTTFNQDVTITRTNQSSGFQWTIDSNGSFSLIKVST